MGIINFIKKIIIFALSIFFIAYFFALLDKELQKLINWIYYSWKGISPIEVENMKMREYYRQFGVQCPSCYEFFPYELDNCPLCGTEMNFIATTQKRMEMRRQLNERN